MKVWYKSYGVFQKNERKPTIITKKYRKKLKKANLQKKITGRW